MRHDEGKLRGCRWVKSAAVFTSVVRHGREPVYIRPTVTAVSDSLTVRFTETPRVARLFSAEFYFKIS